MNQFKVGPMGNSICEGKGFYISFTKGNPMLPSFFAPDTGAGETALVKNGKYYILNGDCREQYLFLVKKGFDECKKLFDSLPEKHSSWSAGV